MFSFYKWWLIPVSQTDVLYSNFGKQWAGKIIFPCGLRGCKKHTYRIVSTWYWANSINQVNLSLIINRTLFFNKFNRPLIHSMLGCQVHINTDIVMLNSFSFMLNARSCLYIWSSEPIEANITQLKCNAFPYLFYWWSSYGPCNASVQSLRVFYYVWNSELWLVTYWGN